LERFDVRLKLVLVSVSLIKLFQKSEKCLVLLLVDNAWRHLGAALQEQDIVKVESLITCIFVQSVLKGEDDQL
jgi:F0F1-type ATP synthase beta subunit